MQPLCILPLNNNPAELTNDVTTLNLPKNRHLYSKFLSLHKKNKTSTTSTTTNYSISNLTKIQKLNIDANVIITQSALITNIQYLKNSGQIVIVSNDHNIYSFDIVVKDSASAALTTTARISLQERR